MNKVVFLIFLLHASINAMNFNAWPVSSHAQDIIQNFYKFRGLDANRTQNIQFYCSDDEQLLPISSVKSDLTFHEKSKGFFIGIVETGNHTRAVLLSPAVNKIIESHKIYKVGAPKDISHDLLVDVDINVFYFLLNMFAWLQLPPETDPNEKRTQANTFVVNNMSFKELLLFKEKLKYCVFANSKNAAGFEDCLQKEIERRSINNNSIT